MQPGRRIEGGRRNALAAGLLLCCAMLPVGGLAQSSTMKAVQGRVFGPADTPIQGAIVYLDDTKSNGVRSFISTKDGSYRFGQLSSDVDYTIWAKYKGTKSDTKTISSFSSKTNVVMDFHFEKK